MNIMICDECEGTGKLTHDHGGHKSDLKTTKCGKCKGSGRMEQEVTVTYKPFRPSPNDSKRVH